jgi:hypothetical protein
MAYHTASGTKLFIGGKTTTPSLETSWTEVGEVSDLGEFGRKYNKVEVKSLSTRGIRKAKGSFDDGAISLGIHADDPDAGQTKLRTALDDDTAYNFKVEENDAPTGGTPTKSVFKALVMSMPKTIGQGDNTVDYKVDLEIISGTIVVTEAAAGSGG